MKSARVDAFFSCSFVDDDKQTNQLFLAICKGLDLFCENVNKPSPESPPDVALGLIKKSKILVAVATKRTQTNTGWLMPTAVQQEITMAYGLGVKILLFCEKGVILDGFNKNLCTYYEFDRDKLNNPDVIENIVSSLHKTKVEVLCGSELIYNQQSIDKFITKNMNLLIRLYKQNDEYCWYYETSKVVEFNENLTDPIVTGIWPAMKLNIPTTDKLLEYSFTINRQTADLKIETTEISHTPDSVEIHLNPKNKPHAGDVLDYSISCSSKYLNAIHIADIVKDEFCVIINGLKYCCGDGYVIISRTYNVKMRFEFPRSYGVNENDIVPFVAGYSSKIDYLAPEELQKCKITKETFGNLLIINFEAENPILHYIYGLAWNPPN